MIRLKVPVMIRARLSRLLAPICVGATLLGLTAAACSVPEFEFPQDSRPNGTAGESVLPGDHCVNNNLDAAQGESDFDCGGGCAPCIAGQHCADVADCVAGLLCHDTLCIEPGCMNDAQDGTETDTDCGGGACKACIVGQGCAKGSDCESGVCSNARCVAPACDDQVKNGKETALDCGGDCSPCPENQPCLVGKDCVSGECNDAVCGSECPDGFANCDKKNDNACEVSTRTDLKNCGFCGNACNLPHATAECSAGECRIATDGCEKGYADCNGDPADGCEIDLKTNKLDCGACNKVCPDLNGDPSCVAGLCQITCNDGFADCDDSRDNGCEVNLKNSSKNCNTCGKVCTATPGYSAYCKDGNCGQTLCGAGKGDCNGDQTDLCEVNLTNDVNNCGDCGHVCSAVNADVACVNSKCVISACKGSFADCVGGYNDGCETDTNVSTSHCGGCGKACTITNGTPACDKGSCEVNSCSGTFRDCDGDPKSGCEVNIATSPKNCGGCGNAGSDCTTKYAHASSSCTNSACSAPSCNAGYGDCSGGIGDGCETDTTSSPANCGACGMACSTAPSAHVSMNTCTNSQCSPQCSSSYLSCDNNKYNGCEADSTTDPNNCGACGTVCSTAASAHVLSNVCTSGAPAGISCSPTCAGSYGDCDSSRTNGCEVDTATSGSNCGGCGKVCDTSAAAHVTSNTCSGSSCQPKCATNYADCDNSRLNGCEKDVSGDKNNCGGCNVVCGTTHAAAGTSCGGGTCNPLCDSGWGKCATPEQGCVTPLGTTTNCTKCGQSCSGGTPFCDPGGCVDHRDIVQVNANLSGVAGWDASLNSPAQITLDHPLATAKGNNRMVLVGVGSTWNFTKTPDNIGVTYDGVPMIQSARVFDSVDQNSMAAVFYLLDAQLPDPGGTKQVVVTFGAPYMWGHGGAHVVELKNTMQVAPIATGGTGNVNNCGASASRGGSITFSQTGSYVYGFLSARGATGASFSVSGSQSSLFIQNQPTPDNLTVAAASVIANGNTTMTWTVNNCYSSAIGMVAVKRLNWN